MDLCCVCEKPGSVLVKCSTCSMSTHLDCIFGRTPPLMSGDIFLDHLCMLCCQKNSCNWSLGAVKFNTKGLLIRKNVNWVDVTHLALVHLNATVAPERLVEGYALYHQQTICNSIEEFAPLLFSDSITSQAATGTVDTDRFGNAESLTRHPGAELVKMKGHQHALTGNWTLSVAHALVSHTNRRFFNGRDVRMERFWALQDASMSLVDIEALLPHARRRTSIIDFDLDSLEFCLFPLPDSLKIASTDSPTSVAKSNFTAGASGQTSHTSLMVYSNLDCDRPNPTGMSSVYFSSLPSHTSKYLVLSQSATANGFDIVQQASASGYRMARSTHGVDQSGTWYFEFRILSMSSTFLDLLSSNASHTLPSNVSDVISPSAVGISSEESDSKYQGGVLHSNSNHSLSMVKSQATGHVRLGVAQILAPTEASVGFDEFSYAIRDKDCASIHCGVVCEGITHRQLLCADEQVIDGSGLSFKEGDVVGVLLEIDNEKECADEALESKMQQIFPFLNLNEFPIRMKLLSPTASSISFFVNGKSITNSKAAVFQPIYQGKYYAAVSLFGSAAVQFVPGPEFAYPPPIDVDSSSWRPFSDLCL